MSNDDLAFLEKAVLACCLIDEGVCVQALDILDPTDFLSHQHGVIFAAMKRVLGGGLVVDPVTVADKLTETGRLEKAGGMSKLSELIDFVPVADNADSYIKQVRSRSVKRKLHRACDTIRQKLESQPELSADEALEVAESHLLGLATESTMKETRHIGDVLWDVMETIESRMYSDEPIGVHTGFHTIDRLTSGLKPGQLILIAGRPGHGKTSIAMNIATNAALSHGTGVAVFSMEMDEGELVERMLCSEAKISSSVIKQGRISVDENEKLAQAAGLIIGAPIYINDAANMSPLHVQSSLRRLMAKHEIGLVIIDYLQLMAGIGGGDNLNVQMTRISRSLKVMAKDFGVPVVALSQLSRGPESRDDPRPVLSDLRDSGSLEQDADIVMFVFREEEYTGPINKKGQDVRGQAEIIVRKHRGGPTGVVKMRFDGPTTSFHE